MSQEAEQSGEKNLEELSAEYENLPHRQRAVEFEESLISMAEALTGVEVSIKDQVHEALIMDGFDGVITSEEKMRAGTDLDICVYADNGSAADEFAATIFALAQEAGATVGIVSREQPDQTQGRTDRVLKGVLGEDYRPDFLDSEKHTVTFTVTFPKQE